MADATMQKMLDRFRIKITKTEPDARSSIRGEKFINPRDPNHDGTAINGVKMPYAIVPAHDPEYLKNTCKNMKYEISEPFIPGVDTKEPAEKK